MALLFAQLEHQIRRTAAMVGRAIVEKVTGFSDPTGRQLPADEPCDWQRDAAGLATAEDHTGYYEATTTCARQLSAIDGVLHACYSDHGHDGDHGCLCGRTWSMPAEPEMGAHGWQPCRAPGNLDCLGCDWYGNCDYPKTSAVPPTAGDDPAASTSQPAAGSPNVCCCYLPGVEQPCGPCRLGDDRACTRLADVETNPHCPNIGQICNCTGECLRGARFSVSPPPTVPAGASAGPATTAPPAGLTPAIAAIFDVLDKHLPQELSGGRYDCNPGTEDCPIWPDGRAWREHVAPIILNAATLGPAGLAANERISAAIRIATNKPQQ